MKRLLFLLICSVAMAESVEQTVSLVSFNAGELSPLMNARVDYPKYKYGAKTLENMLVRVQGPVSRRPGTKYIAAVKDATKATRLISFEYSTDLAYIIELGDEYARFYRAGAQILDGAVPYEIVTPWDHTDLFEIQFTQDAGTMRLVHPDYEPYKLTRTADDAWTATAVGSTTGPFLDENFDTTWTLTPSATTGAGVDIASTDNLFDANHVGGTFQISHVLQSTSVTGTFSFTGGSTQTSSSLTIQRYRYIDAWTSGIWSGTIFVQRSYDAGSSWLTVWSAEYSFNGNIHFSWQETDDGAIYRIRVENLEYQEGLNYKSDILTYNLTARVFTSNGVVKITSVTDANNAVVTVLYDMGSTSATYHWSEGAWSGYRGYPRTIEHHEQRVLYGGSESYPQTIWASIIASQDSDYDDFTASTESDWSGNLGGPDDIAWTYELPGTNPIQWLKAREYVMVGTTSGVGRLGQPDKPISPNFPPIFRMQPSSGSAYMQSVIALDAVLYVERGKEKIRELTYAFASERYVAPDLTILAEHITGDGIVEIDFQNRPEPVLWCVREDGQLLSFTYHRRNDSLAWTRNDTGASGEFMSVAVIPGTNEDEVWSVVDRTVNSTSVSYVEQFQPLDWGTDQNDCYFVDSGSSSLTGNTHLEGETVALYADGRPIGTYTVSGGTISPPGSYTNTTVGLPYTSVFETMPLMAQDKSGNAINALETGIHYVVVDFYKTLGCHVGVNGTSTQDFEFSTDDFATTLDVVTAYKDGPVFWGTKRSPTLYFEESSPIPMTIRSVQAKIEVEFD